MKITEYPSATSVEDSDLLIIETGGGTKKVSAEEFSEYCKVEIYDPAVTHRNVWRGKNLGSTFTDAQKAAIQNGTFDDLYVGDYWEDGNITWRIADIDYFIRETNQPIHHIVVMPDKYLYLSAYHSVDNIGSVGYINSDIKKTYLNSAKNMIKQFFGNDCLPTNFSVYMPSAVNSNELNTYYSIQSANTDVDLPTCAMLFGEDIIGTSLLSTVGRLFGNVQFSGARLNPTRFVVSTYYAEPYAQRYSTWILNPSSSIRGFALEKYGTLIDALPSNSNVGVRPYAIIKG